MTEYRDPITNKAIDANMLFISTSSRVAHLKEVMEDWSEAFSNWNDVYESAQYILAHSDTTNDEKSESFGKLKDSIFGMGKALYELNKLDEARKILETGLESHIIDDRAMIILGLVNFKSGDSNNLPEYAMFKEKAYNLLRILEYNPNLDIDLKYKFFGLYALGLIYRMAETVHISGVDFSMESAYRCTLAAARLGDLPSETQSFIDDELRKYRKDEFGEFTYEG